MRICILCFSLTGQETARALQEGLMQQDPSREVLVFSKSRYLEDSIPISSAQWAAEWFEKTQALVFVGACGIAVRSIAPLVQSKKTDPAVLVADECGRFVISLMSGHLGGANALCQEAAHILKAQPVITTATDLHGRFAVDEFARKNGCAIRGMGAARAMSAALLAGEPVGFMSDFPVQGSLPEGLISCRRDQESWWDKRPEIGLVLTVEEGLAPFAQTVTIIPPVLALGMGCRKGIGQEEAKAEAAFALQGICKEALFAISSIDVKKEEPALLSLAQTLHLPFLTYSAEELLAAKGEFAPSAFVRQTVGVDNVCERAAVTAAGQGMLIRRKHAKGSVTSALAQKDWKACLA